MDRQIWTDSYRKMGWTHTNTDKEVKDRHRPMQAGIERHTKTHRHRKVETNTGRHAPI
jgi:hypothetical protein